MKTLRFWPIAWTLAVFLSLVYTLDVVAGLLLPNWYVMHKAWELILPDYTFISWGSFFLGLVEIFIGGFLSAVLFIPIYNFFASRGETKPEPATMETAGAHQ